jgi:hypothetical protein
MTLTRDHTSSVTNREALHQASQHSRIEGLQATEFAKKLFKQLERSELTIDEVRAKLITHHKVG